MSKQPTVSYTTEGTGSMSKFQKSLTKTAKYWSILTQHVTKKKLPAYELLSSETQAFKSETAQRLWESFIFFGIDWKFQEGAYPNFFLQAPM